MNTKSLPGFDEKLSRPFPVHEYCYDCAESYHGCSAWPEKRPFDCADYYRLPDVMPGTCGQVFPPSRMQGRKKPRVRREPATDKTEPQSQQGSTEGRRKYMREYMREYMRRRRANSAVSQPLSEVPSPHAGRPSDGRGSENVKHRPCAVRVPAC